MQTEMLLMVGCLPNCIEQEKLQTKTSEQQNCDQVGVPCVALVSSGTNTLSSGREETMVEGFVKEVCV